MGHKQRLMQYLLDNEGITQKKSTEELGNTRLAATIHTLRKGGIKISSINKKVPTRFKDNKGNIKYSYVTFYKLDVDKKSKSTLNMIASKLREFTSIKNLLKK